MVESIVDEMTTNEFVDVDVNVSEIKGAAIEEGEDDDQTRSRYIRSYDLDKLRRYEERYEAMYELQAALVATDRTQLELVNTILYQISEEVR